MQLETPWHVRQATYSHFRRYRKLTELHELTTAWIEEIQAERPAHTLERGLNREITENLWMLQSLGTSAQGTPTPVESLLDDTSPDDVLNRLERTVWAVQGYTLHRLREKSSPSEIVILDSVLEQIAWRLGRRSAERTWSGFMGMSGAQDSRSRKEHDDLRRSILTLEDTAFASPFLTIRATLREVQVELLQCPHRSLYHEVKSVADSLCEIHSHWTRGFAYGLNPKILMETTRENSCCRHRWTLSGTRHS